MRIITRATAIVAALLTAGAVTAGRTRIGRRASKGSSQGDRRTIKTPAKTVGKKTKAASEGGWENCKRHRENNREKTKTWARHQGICSEDRPTIHKGAGKG